MSYRENDELYRRTQLLFKKRREARVLSLRKKADKTEKPKPTSPSEFVAPQYPPSQTLGKYITRYTPYYYQPPKQPLPEDHRKPSEASQPSRVPRSTTRSFSKESSPSKLSVPYPPPRDTNYSKVPSRAQANLTVKRTLDFDSPEPQILNNSPISRNKFVDCEKCGKKNFSSVAQLAVHQRSKKCKNRQDRNTFHKCQDCFKVFDTRHNLQKHICRL